MGAAGKKGELQAVSFPSACKAKGLPHPSLLFKHPNLQHISGTIRWHHHHHHHHHTKLPQQPLHYTCRQAGIQNPLCTLPRLYSASACRGTSASARSYMAMPC
jgi:hypothetical protein